MKRNLSEPRHTVSPTDGISYASMAPMPRAVSFDFDNTLLLSEACKHATMREVCNRHEGGLEVLQTVPYDSRTAPPGVVVTRHTIFEGVARGLLTRGTPSPLKDAPQDAERFGQHLCAEFSSLLEARLLERMRCLAQPSC